MVKIGLEVQVGSRYIKTKVLMWLNLIGRFISNPFGLVMTQEQTIYVVGQDEFNQSSTQDKAHLANRSAI